ncbi:predicted protein [Histoplasma capsulatum var. duboisii H88]|uniref:Predicted protein n=1 Tax=Ajellomyces capsulatus (strain H88) TaxID=544711 RepID=F0UUG9_AJEC8|nr:predicted protein [Histoplasma capsulatum var. duboisii H88]
MHLPRFKATTAAGDLLHTSEANQTDESAQCVPVAPVPAQAQAPALPARPPALPPALVQALPPPNPTLPLALAPNRGPNPVRGTLIHLALSPATAITTQIPPGAFVSTPFLPFCVSAASRSYAAGRWPNVLYTQFVHVRSPSIPDAHHGADCHTIPATGVGAGLRLFWGAGVHVDWKPQICWGCVLRLRYKPTLSGIGGGNGSEWESLWITLLPMRGISLF